MEKRKILVIDDEEDLAELLAIRLAKSGYYVSIATDGSDGLSKIRTAHPDLVILDLMLPGMTGEEVCKAVREDDNVAVSRIPIVMLTAKATQADRIVGRVIGANSYITKPFDPDDLLTEISRFLKSKSVRPMAH